MTKSLRFLVLLCCFTAACGAPSTTTTVLEPVADRLPADPLAPTADWVTGTNAAGWVFHRRLVGNAVSSPVSLGLAAAFHGAKVMLKRKAPKRPQPPPWLSMSQQDRKRTSRWSPTAPSSGAIVPPESGALLFIGRLVDTTT